MINMNIWNKSYNQDWLEMSENLKEDEVILLIPTKVKFDKEGEIINRQIGNTFDNYKYKIQKEKERKIIESLTMY